MVGRRFQLDFLHPKYPSYKSHPHFSILGLILAYCTTLFSQVETLTVNCKKENISSKYQHCAIQPGGVHSLDCFGKHHLLGHKTCEWKSGNQSSQNTYTLIRRQGKKLCHAYFNLNRFSENIFLYEKFNVTVEVFENIESTNCTKAVFSGSPRSILRCAPPNDVSFNRHSGKLVVSVSWTEEDRPVIKNYSVRYKAVSSTLWSESLVQCQNEAKCTVENLTSSLEYNVQIQCVTNDKCSQCVWSKVYTVPEELTTQPLIVSLNDTDINGRKGQRLLSVAWTFPAAELYDGFHVSIWKASEEGPCERKTTTRPEIRLILSYSAYYFNISAFNNASNSPAVKQTILPRENESSLDDGKLNVTVHSSRSFTVSWSDNLIQKYVCYSVEWMKKGQKAAHMPFYENENNNRTLTPLPETLEPYKRYSITLHTRPNKDTCNMKHINNSESTYGSTLFYFMEGSPISAPTNISSYNITLNSAVLQWSPIPEEDIRGFLLGYIIHFTENRYPGTSIERNITVDPTLNSCELENLKSSTTYRVQISGFTKAGEGVLSSEVLFKTNFKENSNLGSFLTVFAVLVTVLIFGSHIIKRAKLILWPSIPNPGKSNAMQITEGPRELELLELINTLKVEEGDTNSLQIIEREEKTSACTSTSNLPLLHAAEVDEESQPEMTHDWIHSAAKDTSGETLPDSMTDTTPDIQRTDLQSSTFAFPTGYTTIELFQQMMPQGVPANTSLTQVMEGEPEDEDMTERGSRLEYVRQFGYRCNLGQ
ncbi:interleukin-31 receptor subunit alpha [Notolabrus celidotus]|uniref:interleukin-31 receptor subunit alpha n=1 Tax=Notolabrus celidotus TaxID=1203425 RepID=UPI00148F561A|nr:interleukin-31 receptor subunit alpha [Notolabrus celidotus]